MVETVEIVLLVLDGRQPLDQIALMMLPSPCFLVFWPSS